MRGASALDNLLAKYPRAPLRVLVVWEPVLKTDFAPPLSRTLALIHDPRVRQFWDPGRIVSGDLVRAVNDDPGRYGRIDPMPPSFIAWDLIAVFGKTAHWERDVPPPAHYDGPVVHAVERAKKAIDAELGVTPPAD